ncbi:LysE family translocator [Pseudogemmobacter faecipullorum]|uniref:LysE family translocator n=1 Tax=Pseudogemmobacter faecipullorum TaxID=2755041 RepID=A0ABS8CQ59_9RHOB|nr:LysE family translocator [Pseudogemmobacter faecipullorum]MCB5411522.1 LysE family translocator [Pseudogemmobacter faecipullorum]
MTLAAFLAAWGLHLVAAASPGPAILMSARLAVTEGFRVSVWLAAGLALGAVFWALAALFGLAILFKIAPALFWGFKIAGGLFLIWIALQMWRHADEPLPDHKSALPRSPLSALWLGIATQLANPKPAVFFGAVFVGTVPPGVSPLWILALMAMICVNEIACNLTIARLFSFERSRRAYARLKAVIDRSFGVVLAALGLKIAIA